MIEKRTTPLWRTPETWIFGLAFAIRLYAVLNTHYVNQDGVLYIHQARSIFQGQWGEVTACILKYLSIYPLLICAVFSILSDWILSARVVSLVFGFSSLIPVYLGLRLFFDRQVSNLALLLIALIPVFISRSADVVREPVYWFFAAWGLYFFLKALREDRNLLWVFISSCAFILAIWARVEAVLYYAVSFLFLLLAGGKKRWTRTLVFLSPLIFLLAIDIGVALITGSSPRGFYRGDDILRSVLEPAMTYAHVQDRLMGMTPAYTTDRFLYALLPEVSNFLWLMALAILVNGLIGGFFFPAFAVFLIGLKGSIRSARSDRGTLYLLVNVVLGILVLYSAVLRIWILYDRLASLVILPGIVVLGFGINKILLFLQHRKSETLSKRVSVILATLLILFSIPVSLVPREKEKAVFREIGETIRQVQGASEKIFVSTSRPNHMWISFFANLSVPDAPCPGMDENCFERFSTEFGPFVEELHRKKIDFLLWDERNWGRDRFDIEAPAPRRAFRELGRWYHPDTGQMILYEVIPE